MQVANRARAAVHTWLRPAGPAWRLPARTVGHRHWASSRISRQRCQFRQTQECIHAQQQADGAMRELVAQFGERSTNTKARCGGLAIVDGKSRLVADRRAHQVPGAFRSGLRLLACGGLPVAGTDLREPQRFAQLERGAQMTVVTGSKVPPRFPSARGRRARHAMVSCRLGQHGAAGGKLCTSNASASTGCRAACP